MARKASTPRPPADPAPPGFRGIGLHALSFLDALRENNDRTWFAENRATFDEHLDAPFRELIRDLGARLIAAGSPLRPNSKALVYRIYRDVRFSKNKNPYKTHLGASLHRGGDKSSPGLLYVHVEPTASFVAAGFYVPEPPQLRAIRQAIADDAAAFTRMADLLRSRGLDWAEADPLTRMPKGFEDRADSPAAPYLRFRSFVVSRPIPDDDLERPDLPADLVAFARQAAPLLEFLWSRTDIQPERKPKPRPDRRKDEG